MIDVRPTAPLRYVALGDSYTIGTSVAEDERWPNQLVAALGPGGPLRLVANLAVNGLTSAGLIEVELPRLPNVDPAFMSLLIGVNDVVQGVPAEAYRRNLGHILDELIGRAGADRVLLVTIPDFTVTPAGAEYGDPAERKAEIRTFNAIAAELAADRSIAVVDVYDLSLQAASDRSLVATDGLHPSAAQYSRWVERIAPTVRRLVGSASGG